MPQSRRSRAVARAILESPASLRALARAAEVSPSVLARIVSEERAATIEVAEAVAWALRQWSRNCERLAARIEAASPQRRA